MLRKANGNYRQVGGVAMIDEMNPTANLDMRRCLTQRGRKCRVGVLAHRSGRSGGRVHPPYKLAFLGVCLGSVALTWRPLGVLAVALADAPTTPFYYASATALDKQVVTLVVGVNEGVGQAVVAGGRKRVTLNMDASLMGDAGIRGFTYQKSGLGFVGSAAPATPVSAAQVGQNGSTPSIAASPGEIAPAVSMLDKPGMVLIAPLER